MSTGSGSKTIERTTTASATAETTGSTGAPQTDGTQTTVLSAERSTTTSRTTTTTVASVKWDGPAGYTIVVDVYKRQQEGRSNTGYRRVEKPIARIVSGGNRI